MVAKKNNPFVFPYNGMNLIFCLDKWKEKLYYLFLKK